MEKRQDVQSVSESTFSDQRGNSELSRGSPLLWYFTGTQTLKLRGSNFIDRGGHPLYLVTDFPFPRSKRRARTARMRLEDIHGSSTLGNLKSVGALSARAQLQRPAAF